MSLGLRHLIRASKINRAWLFVGIGLLFVSSLLSLSPYLLTFYHIDSLINLQSVIDAEQTATLQSFVNLVLWITLALFLLSYLGALCCQYTAMLFIRSLRHTLSDRISLLQANNTRMNSIELRRIIHDDLDTVASFIGQQIPEMIKAISIPLVVMLGLAYIDWRLTLAISLPLPLLALIIPYSAKRKKKHNLRQGFFDTRTSMDQAISQFITALPVIQNYGLTVSSFSNYSSRVETFRQFMHLWIDTMIPHWSRYFSFLANASLPMIALGLWLYLHNGLDLNTLLLFLVLGPVVTRPLFALANTGSQLAIIRDIDSRLEAIYQQATSQKKITAIPADSGYQLDNLCVSSDGTPILHNVTTQINSGNCVALIGPSGSGKTTLAHLLARLKQPSSGSIQLGGVPLDQLDDSCIRQQISFAFQHALVFGISLRDNIRLGLQASDQQVEEAARKARCHQFITDLDAGYQTIPGEDIATLSGGQIQRIQLARVLLKNAPILILDEATSFTDADNEELIQQAIAEIQCQMLIVITHRLRTVVDADTILVLDRGRLIASGTHQELLHSCQLYNNLWHAQHTSKGWQIRS